MECDFHGQRCCSAKNGAAISSFQQSGIPGIGIDFYTTGKIIGSIFTLLKIVQMD